MLLFTTHSRALSLTAAALKQAKDVSYTCVEVLGSQRQKLELCLAAASRFHWRWPSSLQNREQLNFNLQEPSQMNGSLLEEG